MEKIKSKYIVMVASAVITVAAFVTINYVRADIDPVVKNFADGTTLYIYDDLVTPVEFLRAQHVKVYTASDNSTYIQVLMEKTETDLLSDIAKLEARIASDTAKKADLESKQTILRNRLDLLPARLPQ